MAEITGPPGEQRAYLFVGGPLDGQRRSLERPRPSLSFPTFDPEPVGGRPFAGRTCRHVEYRLMPFAGERERFEVYALAGLSADDVIRALLGRYGVGEPAVAEVS